MCITLYDSVKRVNNKVMEKSNIVKEARESLKLSQTAFAERLMVSPGYVSMLEKGDREPSERLLASIRSLLATPAQPKQSSISVVREESHSWVIAQDAKAVLPLLTDEEWESLMDRAVAAKNAEAIGALADELKRRTRGDSAKPYTYPK